MANVPPHRKSPFSKSRWAPPVPAAAATSLHVVPYNHHHPPPHTTPSAIYYCPPPRHPIGCPAIPADGVTNVCRVGIISEDKMWWGWWGRRIKSVKLTPGTAPASVIHSRGCKMAATFTPRVLSRRRGFWDADARASVSVCVCVFFVFFYCTVVRAEPLALITAWGHVLK